uniref:DYW domain-containing protein n=1 Tax=Oryza nivara TaxID=4536 RepID=A0A0E0HDH5_ORYNI
MDRDQEQTIHLLAGDSSHPMMAAITDKLRRLTIDMRRLGFNLHPARTMSCMMWKGKIKMTSFLTKSWNTPLGVIKNLWICGNCHEVMKFISCF